MPESTRPDEPDARKRFDEFLVKLWDDLLDEQDAVALGELMRDHAEFRQEYLEAKHSIANLGDLCRSWQMRPLTDDQRVELPAASHPRPAATHASRWAVWGAVAAGVLIGFFLARPGLHVRPPVAQDTATAPLIVAAPKPPVVATVIDAVSTDIVEMLPLFAGRELTAGQVIELDAGITELRFRCGASAVLAGPARMAIEGPKRVRLDVGRLTVKMDEGMDGFEVFTPDGKVTDLGTSFGVSVANHGKSQVAVFEGEVELESDRESETPERLLAGQTVRFSQSGASESMPDQGALRGLQNVSLRQPDYALTASKDAYVRGRDVWKRYEIQNYGKTEELLVKYESAATQSNRRAWLSFDLSKVSREQLIGARLRLTVLPNHLAEEFAQSKNLDYAQSDTTWEFEVAGLWDEYYDEWSEDDITWNNAPGNAPQRFSGRLAGPRAPVALGVFTVHAGGQRGDQVVLAGSRLLEFLREDRDGRVTLIVSRRTPCFYNSGEDVVVHGFASREHSELPAPTLELWSEKERAEVMPATEAAPAIHPSGN